MTIFRRLTTVVTLSVLTLGLFTSAASADTGSISEQSLDSSLVSSLVLSVEMQTSTPEMTDISRFRTVPIRVDENCVPDPDAGLTPAEVAELQSQCR